MNTNHTIKMIGYDLDNTLIDSIELIEKAWSQAFQVFNLELTDEFMAKQSGSSSRNALNSYFGDKNDDCTKEAIVNIKQANLLTPDPKYLRLMEDGLKMDRLFGRLESELIKLSLITSASEKFVEAAINANPVLQKFFDIQYNVILKGRDYADSESKPSGIPLQKMMDKFTIQPHQFIYIGDANNDRSSAKNANCNFIAYTNYGRSSIVVSNTELFIEEHEQIFDALRAIENCHLQDLKTQSLQL